MGKNKKHNKNRSNAKMQTAQRQGSSVTIETREKQQIGTSQQMDVEGEVSSRTQLLNMSKEGSDISATTELDNTSFDDNAEEKNSRGSGNDKRIQYNTGKESQTYPNKDYGSVLNKRRSEPWKTKVEFDDKRKDIKSENVTERRQNNRRDDSHRTRRDRSKNDRALPEFEAYKEEIYRNPRRNYKRTIEIEKDLFLMPKEYSLGHCVAEDMNMGSGIAVRFRYQFKRVDELLNQRAKTGGLAVLVDDERFIYYLVTKRLSTGKPTNRTLFASLQKLREHIIKNDVKKLALPRIGCGLDRLYWDEIKFMIDFIFENVDIEIKICNLQTEESPQLRHKNCRLTNVTYPIQNIEEGTIIIYLSSEDGFVSEEMKLLDEKFHFLTEFRRALKTKGSVIVFDKCDNYLLCGCIVKKTELDSVDFSSLQKCVNNIQKENRKYQFGYVGFQAMKEDDDSCFNSKVINILRNNLRDVDVYVCWPDDLQNELLATDRSSEYTSRTSFEQGRDRRSLNLSSSRDSWRNSSPSASSRNNRTNDFKREEEIRKPVSSEADWPEENDSTRSVKEQSNENSIAFRNVKSPRVKIILDAEINNSRDNKSSRTENTFHAPIEHYLPSTSAHKTKTDDSKKDEQNKKWVSSEVDWFEKGTNFEDKKIGQVEYTRTGNKSHERWDDSEVEDDETPKSNEDERSLGMTSTKTKEYVWPSDQQNDEDSFEDNVTHSKKKPRKYKDTSKDEWYADDQPQTRCVRDVWPRRECVIVLGENTFNDQYKGDVSTSIAHSQTQRSEQGAWANPDCKPFQPRQKLNTTVREENPARNNYKKDCWEAKSHGQSHCERDVWTSADQNITVKVVDDQLHTQKSKNDDRVGGDRSHARKSKKGDRVHKDYSQRQYQRDVWTSASQNISAAEDREDSWYVEDEPHSQKPKIGDGVNKDNSQSQEDVWTSPSAAEHGWYTGDEPHSQKSKKDVRVNVQQENRLIHLKSGLHQMKKKSIIIYWASEDGYISDEMKSLDKKFEFIKDFEEARKKMGNVIKYKQNEDHVLYGCIVKKIHNQSIDFRALHRSLIKINECNKTEMLKVVGIQAVRDQDETINSTIINVIMNVLQDITLNVCWPGDLKQKMPKI